MQQNSKFIFFESLQSQSADIKIAQTQMQAKANM